MFDFLWPNAFARDALNGICPDVKFHRARYAAFGRQ